jgi:competence protein ComGC/uncharacterized protein YbaR (Trm112 family)
MKKRKKTTLISVLISVSVIAILLLVLLKFNVFNEKDQGQETSLDKSVIEKINNLETKEIQGRDISEIKKELVNVNAMDGKYIKIKNLKIVIPEGWNLYKSDYVDLYEFKKDFNEETYFIYIAVYQFTDGELLENSKEESYKLTNDNLGNYIATNLGNKVVMINMFYNNPPLAYNSYGLYEIKKYSELDQEVFADNLIELNQKEAYEIRVNVPVLGEDENYNTDAYKEIISILKSITW